MYKQQLKSYLKKINITNLKKINIQFVESKSNTDFPYKVQVKVCLRELKIELEKNE